MSNTDIDTHPSVIAARQEVARKMAMDQADRLPPKVKGEIPLLRKIAANAHTVLSDYDKLESPPNVAGTLAMAYDMIVARLDELSLAYEAKNAAGD